jgi:PAS domain S-box-containing protein
MRSPSGIDGTLSAELTHLRQQVRELQQALAQSEQNRGLATRKQSELTLQAKNETLEAHVRERTASLERAVIELKQEIERRQQAESALKAREQRYQSLYEHNPFMYFTLTSDGIVLSVNRFGAEQLGYQKEDLIGQSIVQVFNLSDRRTVLERLTACVASPYTLLEWETQKIRKDGTRLWVKERARAVHDHTGLILVLVVCEDITERKQTEKQLQETSRLLRTLVNESALPLVSLNREGRVLSWNQAATHLFGWSEEEVLGRELPYVQAGEEATADALWERGIRGELIGPIEMRRQRKSGQMLDLLLWPVFVHDEFEQVSLAVGLYVDQSDLKRAEEAKLMSEARLRSFLNALDDLAFEFDQDGRYLNAWTRSENKLLLPKSELIGRCLSDVFGPKTGTYYLETIRHVIATGKTAAIDYSVLPSGNRQHFAGILTYIPGIEGGTGTVGCIVRDVTESRHIESHVRENEDRWRALYEHAGVGIAQLTLDGQFLRVNPHLCKILGYSSEAMVERNYQDFTHPDDLQANLAYLAELLAGKRHSFSMEERYRRIDHTWVWVDLTVSLVHTGSSDQAYLIAVIQNVDDRKRSHSLLQAAMNSVADGLLIVDGQGKVTSANQRFLSLWNIPDELADCQDDDALLLSVMDQLQDPQAFLDKVRELYAHPAKESFDVLHFKDGRVFERHSRPQILDREIVGRVWTFRDVTKHKRAEEALRTSELRLQRFVAEAPVGLCIFDENWRAISTNRAMCELTGYEEEEIIGSTYALYTHPEDLSANIVLTDEFFRRIRSNYTYEKRYIRKSGEIIWVSVKATRIELSSHEGPLLLAAVQDITERKLAIEEREQLSRDLHDNLLQALYAVGMQLEAGKLAMKHSARRSKLHMSQAINQLNNLMVDVRRFIALLTKRTPSELDFGQGLNQLIASMTGTGDTAPELDIKSPVLSFITPQLAEQLLSIVREALSNSMRHAHASHRWVQLSLIDNSIRLVIGDNGVGFVQTRRRLTGHGLSNMAARTQRMFGTFTLQSTPRRGTIITVDVPLKKGAVYE